MSSLWALISGLKKMWTWHGYCQSRNTFPNYRSHLKLYWSRVLYCFLAVFALVTDLFSGQLSSSLHCSVCSHYSYTFDVFCDLSLPIPKVQSLTPSFRPWLGHVYAWLSPFFLPRAVLDMWLQSRCDPSGMFGAVLTWGKTQQRKFPCRQRAQSSSMSAWTMLYACLLNVVCFVCFRCVRNVIITQRPQRV